jgi:hypothetical protein
MKINLKNLLKNKQPVSKRQWIAFWVFIGVVLIFGYVSIYQQTTGLYPITILNKPEAILPPQVDYKDQTYEKVIAFMKSDDTDSIPYSKGFNCVDSVFRIFLNARWQGITAVPIAIQYDEPPGHMVIGFPTIDKGDVFFETQNDMQIRPRVGDFYNGRKIRGFYYLDLFPKPLENSPEYDSKNIIE